MKMLSRSSIANRPDTELQPCHKRRFFTFGAAAAGVLLSTIFASGAAGKAQAQDKDSFVHYVETPRGKAFRVKGDTTLYHLSDGYRIKTDTTYTYVDSSSDTIRRFTNITYEVVRDSPNPLVERLTAWAAPLPPKEQEALLLENLKMRTSGGAVMEVAKRLNLPGPAMQRLQAAAGSGGIECPAAGIQRRHGQMDALGLTTQGLPLNMQDRERMLCDNLNLVGLHADVVFQAAKNLGLSDSAMRRLQDTLKKRRDADDMVRDVADVYRFRGPHDPKKQEERLREYLTIGEEPDAVFLAAEKLGLPDSAIKRLRLFLREFYARADKRLH